MIMELDYQSEVPVYLQIRNEIVKGIGRGQIDFGEQLPTVRSLSADIGVNTMTVSKAYKLLDQQGYIVTDRRRGAVVCAKNQMPDFASNEGHRKELILLASEAALGGCSREEFLDMCREAYVET